MAIWPIESRKLAPLDRIGRDFYAKRHVFAFHISDRPAVRLDDVRGIARDRSFLISEKKRNCCGAQVILRIYEGEELSCQRRRWRVGTTEREAEEVIGKATLLGELGAFSLLFDYGSERGMPIIGHQYHDRGCAKCCRVGNRVQKN